ncbi:MAG: tRNA (guanosine(46)-N7)-methyltransferase TrmB [Candidatus Schmidhempelia sp.]|nr:tRNA (guanosine(46)-N7)-methyltransferase TrmB [Candidatus Schmidhempelia sp.]
MLEKNVTSIEYDEQGNPIRRIRSFVRRQGRLTKGQAQAITELWPVLGIEYKSSLRFDFAQLFGRQSAVTLEIGFGMGASLVEMAKQHPERDYLGIEVHQPGVGACLMAAKETELTNIRVMCHDAVEVLQNNIPDDSLDMVQLFFPDPWHKARHHKRRIVQTPFVELVRQKLAIGGIFHMATDWENYAEHMVDIMNALPNYQNLSATMDYVERPASRPMTKFERRGQRLGHGVWDLMYKRIA